MERSEVCPPGSTRAVLSRRALLPGALGGAGLVLTACTEEESPAADGGIVAVASAEEHVALPPGAMHVPADPGHGIELPGTRYRVLETVRVSGLRPDHAEAFGVALPDGPGSGTLPAATEEVFVLSTVLVEAPRMMPADPVEGPERTERLLVRGKEHPGWPGLQRGTPASAGPSLTVLASLPDPPSPEDLVLEVTEAGRVQALSLIDGSRRSSDLEEFTRGPLAGVAEIRWWQRDDDEVDAVPALAGVVRGAEVLPCAPGLPWSEPGTIAVGVVVQCLPAPQGTTQSSTLALRLADGSEATALADPAVAFDPPEDGGRRPRAWFAVPRDAQAVTVVLDLALRIADRGTVDLGTEEVPLEILRSPR